MHNMLVLLCGFVVTLGLLQGSAAAGCSSEAFNNFSVFVCPSYHHSFIYDNSSSRSRPGNISELRLTF